MPTRYFRKKTGEWVNYKKNAPDPESRSVYNKSGSLSKVAFRHLARIYNRDNPGANVKPEDMMSAYAKVQEHELLKGEHYTTDGGAKRHFIKTDITVGRLLGSIYGDRMQNMFNNLGMSPEEASNRTRASVKDLMDHNNWKSLDGQLTFTDPATGTVWNANFTYDGDTTFTLA